MTRARALDIGLALGLSALALVEAAVRGTEPLPFVVAAGAFVCSTGALAWRRTQPILVGAVVVAGIFATLFAGLDDDNLGQFLAYLVASYSVGAYAGRGRAAVGFLAAYVTCVATLAVTGTLTRPDELALPDMVGMVALVIGSAVLGLMLRRRDATVRDLQHDAERLAAERAEREQRAIEEERARIARELHDIVGHAVSLMVLQTGAGRKTLRTDPDRTETALLAAERTGREALTELKRLIGIMRAGDDSDGLAPQPDLNQVEGLVRNAEAAGLDATYEVSGEPMPVPPGLALSAYRIVQEAITNTIKHANASHVCVRIHHGAGELRVAVSDDGPATPGAWDSAESGHGLAGMRERIALYGGTLSIRPGADRGVEVVATFPLEAVS